MSDDRAEPAPAAVLRRIDHLLGRIEEVALAISLLTLIVVGAAQAILRNFLGSNPDWVVEVMRDSVFFVAVTGGALAAQSDRLFNIDMMTRLLAPRGRLVVRILTCLFTAWVVWQLVRGGFYLRSHAIDPSEGDLLKLRTVWLAFPLAMGLIAAHMVLHAASDFLWLLSGRLPRELVEGVPKE